MSWGEVKKINSDMSTPLDKLVKSGVVPVVKSVQRGTASGASNSSGGGTVTISAINPAKTIVLFNTKQSGAVSTDYANATIYEPCLTSLSNTSFSFSGANQVGSNTQGNFYSATSFGWQVIEFY